MPLTLTGRTFAYVFLLALFAAFVGMFAAFVLNFIYWLIGHRRFVPWSRVLRFKREDMQKTSKQVDEILDDKNGKKKNKRRS